MKNAILLFVSIVWLFSCSKNDNEQTEAEPELIGNWKLVEIYADPGDGSGDFMTVESDKTVKFSSDNVISSNGNLCFMSIESNNPSEGTFSATDQTFNVGTCGIVPFASTFHYVGVNLIINYPCIKACQEKYIKIE